jgi:3-oxoacyl-[acyl-carrier-protein] synthase II
MCHILSGITFSRLEDRDGMKNHRRVVLTGLGVIAPNGIGKQAFWESLIAGKSGVDWITAFDPTPYPCKVAAEVKDFRPQDFMRGRTAHWGRFSKFAVAAARLALDDSKLNLKSTVGDRVLVCIGNAMNGSGDVYDIARIGFDRTGLAGIPKESGFEFAAHAPSSHVSRELGITGQGVTMASACSTGLDVLQWASDQVAAGKADVVFAGSTEAPISEFCFATLCALRDAISTFDDPPLRASRPFDLRRSGLVLGEGAAVCVVEELEHAQDRGAHIYAEVLGFGSGNEGGIGAKRHSRELALANAIAEALDRAAVTPGQIDYVNIHGNSMPDYDVVDTRAFRKVLGNAADNIPFSSVKSMIGHAMGAAASFQIAATCLSLEHGIIPPTINYEIPDPNCDLDYVPNNARTCRIHTALINAHAIGGTYSAAVLSSPRT